MSHKTISVREPHGLAGMVGNPPSVFLPETVIDYLPFNPAGCNSVGIDGPFYRIPTAMTVPCFHYRETPASRALFVLKSRI